MTATATRNDNANLPAGRNAPMPSISVERTHPMNLDSAEKELIETLRGHETSTGLTLVIEQAWGNWSVTESNPVGTVNKASTHPSTAVGKGKSFKSAWENARKAERGVV